LARVLVLDGHSPAALAFVRSLGRAKHWVAVGFAEGSFAPAALSRYCRLRLDYPAPTRGTTAFCASVVEFARQHNVDIIMPMTDATTWPLSKFRESSPGFRCLAAADADIIEGVSDKFRTITMARKSGIPVPETLLVRSSRELEQTVEWSLPVVVKDRFSIRWIGDTGVKGSVSYAYSRDQLCRELEERLHRTGDVLVQQFTCGVGIGFSCFALDGDTYLPFQWQRIREKDPRGSGSSARKSMALEPTVLEFGRELVAQAGFQGILMIEFKKDPRSGSLTFMEINGRPWGSIQLPVHCGVDYPRYAIRWYLEGFYPPKMIDYRRNITCRWLAADLTHLENLWQGKPAGWPMEYPSFLASLLKISVPWYPGLRYDDLSLRDPRPGLAGLAKWFGGHFGGRT